jgi:hypothetical protein
MKIVKISLIFFPFLIVTLVKAQSHQIFLSKDGNDLLFKKFTNLNIWAFVEKSETGIKTLNLRERNRILFDVDTINGPCINKFHLYDSTFLCIKDSISISELLKKYGLKIRGNKIELPPDLLFETSLKGTKKIFDGYIDDSINVEIVSLTIAHKGNTIFTSKYFVDNAESFKERNNDFKNLIFVEYNDLLYILGEIISTRKSDEMGYDLAEFICLIVRE